MKPVLAILLEFGFHEIKKYIHSGFAKKMSGKFDIVWLAVKKNNKEFDDYFRSTGFPLIYIDNTKFAGSTKIEGFNQSVRRSYSVNQNKGLFHNYSTVRKKSFKTILIGNILFRYFFEIFSLDIINKHYFSEYLKEIFKSNNVNMVLTTSYASSFTKSAMITAHQLNLKTWHLVNSWKDLYINNFLPYNFLDGVFVWYDRMKEDYIREMSYLNPDNIFITGNPTFDILSVSKPHFSREYYAEKYQLPINSHWILYTMMPPGIVNDEIETIQLAAKEVLKTHLPEEYCILVRRNPNHDKNDFLDVDLPSNMKLAEHYCTFDKKTDMIVQSTEGEQEWIDLLHYCDVNFSVPSTVTLEFLTLGKPVLNIGFGSDGKEDPRVRQHFEAGFYRPLFKENKVSKVMDIRGLNNALINLPLAPVNEDMKKTTNAADKIIDIMLKTI